MIPLNEEQLQRLRGNVLVLTGAGISVASGISPFRGDGGLYEGLNPYELASPEAFARQPVTVWNWYLMRISQGKDSTPNAGHFAIARLSQLSTKLTLVTSNVDELHEEAGSPLVYHLHGKVREFRCTRCHEVVLVDPSGLPQQVDETNMPKCICGGLQRPNVVWFGEFPSSEAIMAAENGLDTADLLLEVGVSGSVSYGITEAALRMGIPTLMINPDPRPIHGATLCRESAEVVLPRILEMLD